MGDATLTEQDITQAIDQAERGMLTTATVARIETARDAMSDDEYNALIQRALRQAFNITP